MEKIAKGVHGGAAAVAGLGALIVSAGVCHAGDPEITITTLVKQGETIPGHGQVGNLPIDVNVNSTGYWLATLPTVNPTGRVILTPDGVHMADGDIVGGDYEISSLSNVYKGLNNLGDIVHRPTLVGSSGFSGILWNHDTIIVRDQISTAPEFSPETPYIGFFRARVDDFGRALLMATVNDEELTGTSHRAMVWLEYDASRGTLTESVLAKRYDQLPGQPEGVLANEFGTNSERFAINNNGDTIFAVGFTGGDTATNAAIYVNHTLVAQKGDFGPFKDVTYNMGTSSTTRVDINDNGDYIILMPLAGGPTSQNQVLLRNNINGNDTDEIIIRKGDPMPFVSPDAVLLGFGTGQQPFITNNGDIIWYGQWSSDSGNQNGLFINDRLIIHSGVTTTPEADVITNLGTTNTSNGIGDTFQVSDDGRYIISRVVLNASTTERAIVLIEIDDIEPPCAPADLNCDGVVDVSDLLLLLGNWGDCPRSEGCVGDINGDGVVDVSDLLLLLGSWG